VQTEAMTDWQGRVFLVTGATGHVGSAVVKRLLTEGARVAALARRAQPTQDQLIGLRADLTIEAEVETAFTQAEQQLGPLWGVLHVAGGWEGGAPVRDTSLDLFDRMLSENLRSAFLVGRAAMRRLDQRGGRIVFVDAFSAATYTRLAGAAAYNVAKAGVIALTKALAEEGAAQGIYSCCVAPNTIDTAANRAAMPGADAARWVPVDAVVEALLSAASPRSGMNGAVLTLPGVPG
jgi:NAD(P)-dependent dehydrogenase (short-subunit alcohol dehydrogenase family)